MSGRLAWGCALLFAVLILVTLNIRGGSSSRPAIIRMTEENAGISSDAGLAQEVRLLRERVAHLESKLSAKLVPRTIVSEAKTDDTISVAVRAHKTQELEVARKVVSSNTVVVPRQTPVVVPAQAQGEMRLMTKRKDGTVGEASWWSDKEEKTAGGWCRQRPPYAGLKPELPSITAGTDKPMLTKELAMKHASKDNMLIATYVNYNRLDFAFTFIKHLRALNQPHFLVGALDEKALRGLQVQSRWDRTG